MKYLLVLCIIYLAISPSTEIFRFFRIFSCKRGDEGCDRKEKVYIFCLILLFLFSIFFVFRFTNALEIFRNPILFHLSIITASEGSGRRLGMEVLPVSWGSGGRRKPLARSRGKAPPKIFLVIKFWIVWNLQSQSIKSWNYNTNWNNMLLE